MNLLFSLLFVSPPLPVLARFLNTLNIFCEETYGDKYELDQYHVYNFAKVGLDGGLEFGQTPALFF